jgi:glycerol uptake facilitator-like aquaporin
VGRMFTNTFAGIAPDSVLPFIGAQLVGAFLGVLVSKGINTVR